MTCGPVEDAAATLTVVRAGLYTTVQDEGRWGWQHLGVPVGGAMDLGALRRANALVGNSLGEAGLEVTLTGCELQASIAVEMAVTGARFDVRVDNQPVPLEARVSLRAGQTLALGARHDGARAYIAVRGGLDTPPILGSRSAWLLQPRRGALQDGDVLRLARRDSQEPERTRIVPVAPLRSGGVTPLRVLRGPDASTDAFETLCAQPYRLASSSNRMAYPLEGQPVSLVAPARDSSGTVHGAVQVFPSGQPVVLMADRQTTGGYPVVAIVVAADLDSAAQVAPGEPVRFVPCSRADALQALMQKEAAWRG